MNPPFHTQQSESSFSQPSPLKNSNPKRSPSAQQNPSSFDKYQDENLSDIENFLDFSQSLHPYQHHNSHQTHQNIEIQNPQKFTIQSQNISLHDSNTKLTERPKVFVHRFGDPASSIKFISINAHDKSKDVIDSEINESKTGINLLIDDTTETDNYYKWTSKKDEALLQLALDLKGDWLRITQHFPDPNIQTNMLKKRYKTLMNMKLPNKARFSKREDARICRYFEVYGTNWETISKLMPGRTPTAIKNRFYSSLRDVINAKNTSDENPPETGELPRHHSPQFPILKENSMVIQAGESSLSQNLRCSEEKLMVQSGHPSIQLKEKRTQGNMDCDQFFSFPYQENGMNSKVVIGSNQFSKMTTLPTFQELPYLNLNNHPLSQNQSKLNKFETYLAQRKDAPNDPVYNDKIEDDFQELELDPALAIKELNDRAALLESLCHQIQDTFNEVKRGKGD